MIIPPHILAFDFDQTLLPFHTGGSPSKVMNSSPEYQDLFRKKQRVVARTNETKVQSYVERLVQMMDTYFNHSGQTFYIVTRGVAYQVAEFLKKIINEYQPNRVGEISMYNLELAHTVKGRVSESQRAGEAYSIDYTLDSSTKKIVVVGARTTKDISDHKKMLSLFDALKKILHKKMERSTPRKNLIQLLKSPF